VGVYSFDITATIGIVVETVRITMNIIDECPVLKPEIKHNPFKDGPYYYTLMDPALVIPFTAGNVGNIKSSQVCGKPTIEILN